MKRNANLLICTLLSVTLMFSCQALKNAFTADADDGDFSFEENLEGHKTYRRVPAKKPARTVSSTGAGQRGKMGVTVTAKDNAKLYKEIEKWYGTPYKYGGCSMSGIDCSCFVKTIYQSVYGINLSRGAAYILNDVSAISRGQLREGDVIFFANNKKSISHVGIYLKDDMFAHASSSKGVTISRLSEKYWDSRYFSAGRHAKVTTKWK